LTGHRGVGPEVFGQAEVALGLGWGRLDRFQDVEFPALGREGFRNRRGEGRGCDTVLFDLGDDLGLEGMRDEG
jgi:hypothetical protein